MLVFLFSTQEILPTELDITHSVILMQNEMSIQ